MSSCVAQTAFSSQQNKKSNKIRLTSSSVSLPILVSMLMSGVRSESIGHPSITWSSSSSELSKKSPQNGQSVCMTKVEVWKSEVEFKRRSSFMLCLRRTSDQWRVGVLRIVIGATNDVFGTRFLLFADQKKCWLRNATANGLKATTTLFWWRAMRSNRIKATSFR